MTETMEDDAPRRITCVLPKGRGMPLIERMHESMIIETGNVGSGRSRGTVASISYGEWQEVDILTVEVMADAAEDVFAFIYREGEIDQPHGGLMYMARLDRLTPYVLPDIVEEEKEAEGPLIP